MPVPGGEITTSEILTPVEPVVEEAPAADPGPSEIDLLKEIRDALNK